MLGVESQWAPIALRCSVRSLSRFVLFLHFGIPFSNAYILPGTKVHW